MADLTVANLQFALTVLEREVREATLIATGKFRDATGMMPSNINIEVIEVSRIGEQRDWAIGQVTANVEL
jgi:hypothetical protein